MAKSRRRKGTYGGADLPLADRYVVPGSGRLPFAVALVCVALLALVLSVWMLLGDRSPLSAGPLSAAHARLENDCSVCHGDPAAVADTSCVACHEKTGSRLGSHSYAAHYLYRSRDFQRVVPSPEEVGCGACHLEHRGRQATLRRVPDGRCTVCHDHGSFESGHPELQRAAAEERSGLHFAHGPHVAEVQKRLGLADVERACLQCHEAEVDGRGFRALDFDRHCDACHLTVTTGTPRLPLADPSQPDEPGLVSLETIRQQGGPGTRWALFADPTEFREAGPRIQKVPLHHQDEWVLHNLRRLRQRLYPDAGLADLMIASPDVPPDRLPELYREMIATLEEQAVELRGWPREDVQQELTAIAGQLGELRRALEDPLTSLDETALLLSLERPPAGPPEIAEAVLLLADELTAPCRSCHLVEKATIARVQRAQAVLDRAEFDHRVHVLERRCLDCHAGIPVQPADPTGGSAESEADRASLQQLPAIAICRDCHREQLGTAGCVTCHLFHPDKSRRAALLLYEDASPSRDEAEDPEVQG